jgi:hypothetical protein
MRASKAAIIESAKALDLEGALAMLRVKPALLEVTDRSGMNLLHLAAAVQPAKLEVAEAAPIPFIDFLLAQGMPIDAQIPAGSGKGCTALFFSVGRGRNLTLARHLIRRGADPRKAPGGGLFAAGWYEDLKILDLLIDHGADTEVVVGVTPFLACWAWRRFEAAKHLAIRGANVNFREPKKGTTALLLGVDKEFDPALLAWLVKHGADPDIEDNTGVNARTRAARKRDKRWLRALGGTGVR